MDMSQYLEIFIEETKEHLQSMNQCLLQVEQNAADAAVLNEIFRVAHTLKGMSGTMGYNRMAKLTHDMENLLHSMRNGEIQMNSKIIDILFKCFDALESYLDIIVNTGNEGNNEYKEIISSLNDIIARKGANIEKTSEKSSSSEVNTVSGKSNNKKACFELNEYDTNIIHRASEMQLNVFKIIIQLNRGCVLKCARAFIIFQALESLGEIIKSEPKVQDIEDEKFDFEFTVMVVTKADVSQINKKLDQISELEKVIITKMDVDSKSETQEEEITEKTIIDENAANEGTEVKDNEASKTAQMVSKAKTGKTVRVDISRLDNLMNLVSELIIIKTRLGGINAHSSSQQKTQNDTQDYVEAIEYLERITTNLHEAVMKVRMVPVETVFNRFPRMIRDIAKDIKKEITLSMSGEETELDRTVIDEIGDPLIHLLRNSADHGIESTQKRRESDKPEVGHISLRAYQEGNNVVIEVEDDGNGIDVEKVKNKAIDRGLISRDVANTLSQKEIIEFLFKPSFSTAEKVTDLSGRGVGLDVVKTKIETLGGNVEVETTLGKGSRFIIRLPLTLAIIQALLVNVEKEKYAIPLSSIKEIISINPKDINLVQKQEVVFLRDMVIPLLRVERLLDVPGDSIDRTVYTAVIVKKGERLTAFLVDSLIGQQEIVVKSLGKMLAGIKFLAGATILGDGNVALILDVNALT